MYKDFRTAFADFLPRDGKRNPESFIDTSCEKALSSHTLFGHESVFELNIHTQANLCL